MRDEQVDNAVELQPRHQLPLFPLSRTRRIARRLGTRVPVQQPDTVLVPPAHRIRLLLVPDTPRELLKQRVHERRAVRRVPARFDGGAHRIEQARQEPERDRGDRRDEGEAQPLPVRVAGNRTRAGLQRPEKRLDAVPRERVAARQGLRWRRAGRRAAKSPSTPDERTVREAELRDVELPVGRVLINHALSQHA